MTATIRAFSALKLPAGWRVVSPSSAIYDVSTPPAYRHQGLGGAITHALMTEIRRRGFRETWIWGSDEAKGVYQKLGYIEDDFGIRVHHWRRNGA